MSLPVFFHRLQLDHKPVYEWAMGERLAHPETTYRAETILQAIEAESGRFTVIEPTDIPRSLLTGVHHKDLLELYQRAREIPLGQNFYPSVFPKRADTRGRPDDIRQAGYFCLDSGTPLTSTTWDAAYWSAASAAAAAVAVESGKTKVAYALCRPPGHHASRDLFGGYCYFNNAAIIARRFRGHGRVAILDIDFHHGNGTQDIFYRDPSVLFISIHGEPKEYFPFFSGYAHETGAASGAGFTMNHPLPKGCDGQEYLRVLSTHVIPALKAFEPSLLILSAGFDTYLKDPIGAFALTTEDFNTVGGLLAGLDYPTVILQEGGYCVEELGLNVVSFLRAFKT
jgi:acetoin utilization deacetylase AcuC-like enzyme